MKMKCKVCNFESKLPDDLESCVGKTFECPFCEARFRVGKVLVSDLTNNDLPISKFDSDNFELLKTLDELAERMKSDLNKSAEPTVPEILQGAAETYRERNAIYKDNYKDFGAVMLGLFPNGLHVTDKESYNKLGLIVMCVGKLTRYCSNLEVGHKDSAHDLMVYAAMLEEITNEK